MAQIKQLPSDLKVFKHGINVFDPITKRRVDILIGAGKPGFVLEKADPINIQNIIDAPIGSLYIDYVNKKLHFKMDSGQWENKWDNFVISSDINSLILGNISWREPVFLHESDPFATINDVITAFNSSNTVDGKPLSSGSRILISNLSVAGESENVYILTGAPGSWILTEDTNQETSGDTLLVDEGISHSGESWTYNGSDWILTSSASSAEITSIRNFIGKTFVGPTSPLYASHNIVAQGDDLETAVSKLDASTPVTSVAMNVTTPIVLDEVLALSSDLLKWVVSIKETSNPLNRSTREVLAVHNKTTVLDATNTQHTIYGLIDIGSPISGFSLSMNLVGTGASQKIQLLGSSTTPVDIKSVRISA